MTSDEHYLKNELYSLVKSDSSIFDFLQESSLDGLWYWDLENPQHEWLSPRFWTLLGYDPNEKKHLASEWQDLIFPEDLGIAIDNFIKHCADPKHSYDQVVRYRHKNGSTIWVRCRGLAIRNDKGKPVRMLGAHTDLTSTKQAEENLKESEERFRLLFEHSADAHVLYKGNQFIDCNQASVTMLGFENKEHLLSLLPADISPKQQPDGQFSEDKAELMIALAIEKGSHRFEWLCQKSDGSNLILNVLLNTIKIGGESVIHGVWRDISERKGEDERRRNLEKQLSNALEIAHLGYWEYDVAEDLFTFNDQFYKIFRTSVEQVGKYKLSPFEYANRFVHPEDRHLVEEETRKSIETTDPDFSSQLEHRIIYADGGSGYISVRFFIVKDSQGRTVKTYGVNQDITDQKKSVIALIESERKWRNILVHVSQIGIALDPRARIVFANEYFLKLTGWKKQEVVDHNWFDLFIPEPVREDVRNVFHTVMGQKNTLGFSTHENEIMDRSGNLINVGWSNVLTKDANGNILDVTCLGVDLTERKRADAQLRKSEEKFRTVASFIHNWEYWIDGDGSLVYISPSCERITSYTEEEFSQDPGLLTKIIHPDDLEIYIKHVDDRAKGTTKEDCQAQDFRILTRNGEERWIAHVCRDVFDREGKHIGRRVSNRDITERKKAEMELIENSQRLQLATASGKLAVWDWNVKDNIMFWDDLMFELYGITRDAFPNTVDAWINGLHPDDKKRAIAESNAACLGEKDYNTTFRVLHPDGTIKHLKANALVIRDNDGKAVRMIGVNSDITEGKKTEEALRENEERYRHLFNISNDAVFVHLGPSGGIPGRFVEVNKAACERLGYSREELLQMSPTEIDAPNTLAEVPKIMEQLIRHGHVSWEGIHLTKDGRHIPVEITNRLFDFHENQMILSSAQDITERKQAEEEREKLQSQLNQAQKMESIGRLAGGVAHDFNNMLGVILGHVEMALDEINNNHPMFHNLREIHTAAQRSADITRQLLAFARKQTIAPKMIDLNQSVEGMLKMLQRLIGEDVALVWKPGYNLWTVKIDSSQLDQILANLCVNARDAISDVGTITIETNNCVFDEEYCKKNVYFVAGDYAALSVSDTGSGIDNAALEHIFEPFYTTKDVGKGTGLGLATVYGIVKQNNGFVNVYSEPGRGTTFKIYLPRDMSNVSQAGTEEASKPAKGGHETILLVEDEPTIMNMTSIMLQRLGYSVTALGTPGEAIQIVEDSNDKIHLLITDLIMPEMNGKDLSEILSAKQPEMQILFMSGYTANVIAHHGVLDEGVHFIQKPFSKKDLAAKVRTILD